MTYQQACFAMRGAIAAREEAVDELIRLIIEGEQTWIWDVPPEVQFALGVLTGAQSRFKQARAEVLGMTIPRGMEKETAS